MFSGLHHGCFVKCVNSIQIKIALFNHYFASSLSEYKILLQFNGFFKKYVKPFCAIDRLLLIFVQLIFAISS